jgi:acyl carrier protein
MDDDPAAMVERLLHRIAPDVDFEHVDRCASLQEVANVDSMDFLNLVSALADATGLEIPERDYPYLISIDGMVAYLRDAPVDRSTR